MAAADRDRRRLEIARAAVRLFAEHGVTGTSGEQIGAAVGMSGRTLWRWFRSKEACVEPLLTQAVDAFVASLGRWPAGVALDRHLERDYRLPPDAAPGDTDAVLALVRLTRTEPGLRAVWLVVHERAEPVLATVLAEHLVLPADGLEVRVHAAAVNAALRIATEEYAAGSGAQDTDDTEEQRLRLAAAVRVATRGTDQQETTGGRRT